MRLFTLLSMSSFVIVTGMQAVMVTIPNAVILNDRFNACGLQEFVERSSIIPMAAGCYLEASRVAMLVKASLSNYMTDLEVCGTPHDKLKVYAMNMILSKPLIFKALLQDYPEALKELEVQGLYNPQL